MWDFMNKKKTFGNGHEVSMSATTSDTDTQPVFPAKHPDPALAANLLQVLIPATDHSISILDGTTLRIEDLACEDLDVTIRVKDGPLRFEATMDWHGTLDGEDFIATQETINAWNAEHTAPRVFGYQAGDGHIRLAADTILAAYAGVSIRQLDEWVRLTLTAVDALSHYLELHWPSAPRFPMMPQGAEQALVVSGETADVATVEEKLLAFATPDNRFGLLGGPTSPVTLERIADLFAAGSGHRPQVEKDGGTGNGVVPIGWGQANVDVALHEGTVTITSGARFGELDPDTIGYLLSVCSRWNTNAAGTVAVVRKVADSGEPMWTLTVALHHLVGTGMTDVQLETIVKTSCETVSTGLENLIAEVTGK